MNFTTQLVTMVVMTQQMRHMLLHILSAAMQLKQITIHVQ